VTGFASGVAILPRVARSLTKIIAPQGVQIDASSHCQLACPSCPTASGATKPGLGAGHLSLENFRTLIDSNPEVARIELSNYGEMFLNPHLLEMLRYAHERQVVLCADNGVNLNHAPDEVLEGLVRYQLRSMTVSIDGASAESYPQYRVKGDFDRVIGHIRRINELKRQYRTGFPLLKWQFIVFGHNEHEINAARALATELGMQFFAKLSWDNDFSPVRNRELVQLQTRRRELSREEFYRATGHEYSRNICYQLWRFPVLNWDGRVTGCCRNFWGEFGGNAFTEGVHESLNSEGMQHARQMLMGQAPERAGLPCTTCELYLSMKRDGRWLTEEEIFPKEQAMSPVLLSVVPEPASPDVTHVDICLAPGTEIDRRILAHPQTALRFEVGRSFCVHSHVREPGDYVIYAFPKRLDPTFRQQYPALPATAQPIHLSARPVAQELRIQV
jgi:MoaA/NifB/PqqE/SkfB family radical SAM enzyme